MSEFIIGLITQWSYLGIFLLMVAENIFPPIPSELIMPFAGYVAARLLGLDRFVWLCNKLGRIATLSEDDIDKADRWFKRHGIWAVFIGRLIPAIRTLISVPAGLAAMPFGQFLAISAIGTVIWTAILTASGYLLKASYHIVEAWVDPVSTGVVVLAVVIYLYRFVTWKPIKDIG